jgi:predicted dehydrogenase
MSTPITVGLLGLGYWGPNLARNFDRLGGSQLKWLCDLSPELRDRYASVFPNASMTADYDDLLSDDSLDAIVLASPVPTHYELGRKAIEAGKHTFIEKPLALTYEHARELADLADERGVKLMVGHLLEYHPGVLKVKDMIETGELGDVLYAYSHRLNLGQFRRDENALWSLGVHDVATLMFLIGEAPIEVSARGESYLHDGVEDVVFGNMRFRSGVMAHIHLSWLDPHKMRKLTVVGDRKMVVFDDMEADRKVTVYDKGFASKTKSPAGKTGRGSYGEYISKREGDIHIPHISNDEPLRLEAQHFLDSILNDSTPRSDGRDGARVVQVLESMQQSLEQGGVPVALEGVAG